MEKKKIIFALPTFSVGGLEKQLFSQFKYYNQEKYNFELITLFAVNDRPNYFSDLPDSIKVKKFSFNKGYLDLKETLAVYKYLKKSKPDLVITSMTSANFLFRILKPFFNYKIICREHNIYTDKKIYHRFFEYIFSFITDQLVAVSDEVADFSAKQSFIKREKYKVIYNGIDLAELAEHKKTVQGKEVIKKDLGVLGNEKIILNVARLKIQKNHRYLIKEFQALLTKFPHYKLFIVGDGQERNNLEKLIKDEKLDNQVCLFGFRTDVLDFYAIADFFVLPSTREGFPNVILESLANGLVTLTSPVPGVSAIIQDGINGYIVESRPGNFSEAMCKIASLSSEAKVNMSGKALESVEEFDIKNIVKKYESLFDEILKKDIKI